MFFGRGSSSPERLLDGSFEQADGFQHLHPVPRCLSLGGQDLCPQLLLHPWGPRQLKHGPLQRHGGLEWGTGAKLDTSQDLLPAQRPCLLLTVSTPPAIISVTLALMSSKGSFSCMMRLQRMPMYSLVLLRCSRRSR